MAFYLGIDGGGTKTKFLVGDEQHVLAETSAPGSNILRSGEDAVSAALHTGIDTCCRDAGITPSEIRRVVAGVAGSANDRVRSSLQEILGHKISGEVEIVGDMVIAHHAALDGQPGVVVNAGTGSIAYGRNEKNETARAGGWGYAISDEGSGHWIGRAAVAEAMRSFDAAKNEAFVNQLVRNLDFERPEELARFANTNANPDFSRVFPPLLALANAGDDTACEILTRAGEALADLAQTVITRIFAPFSVVHVAAVGGVFRISDVVYRTFQNRVQVLHPSAVVSLSTADPALGALMMARQSR
jgi:glucosamine kinase